MAGGVELTGKLTVDATGFLPKLKSELDKGASAVASFFKKASGDVDVNVDTSKAESKLGGLSGKLQGLFSGGALSVAGGALLSGGITAAASAIGDAFNKIIDDGSKFQAGMAELSAITGLTGPGLEKLGKSARDLALEFGTTATGNIEAFKGTLSRLGSDLPTDEVESIARSINTLSAASGDDAAASMDALTSSLLQFQVPLDGTVSVGNEAAKMMNVLAAGAKFGAAEIPQVSDAIKVAGVAASGAKVSFEETNAAIQALAAGGKVGAEAGTALRNVLGTLGQGRFLPKDTADSLRAAGVDIKKLGDTAIPFTDRLRELQKITSDAALTTKLFGTENAAAANILIRSVDAQDKLKEQITGTNVATEQAATRQATFTAAFDRFKASITDKAIAVFEKLVPSLTVGLGLLGDVTGFVADNFELFIGPLAPLIDAVKLVTGAIRELTDAQGVQVDAMREANEVESDGLAAKIKTVDAEIKRQTAIKSLATEFDNLARNTKRTAAEEKRLQEVSVLLNQEVPGLVTSTNNYTDSLADVRMAAADAQQSLRSLGSEMAALTERQRAVALQSAKINVLEFANDISTALAKIDIDTDPIQKFFSAAAQASQSGTKSVFESAIAELELQLTTAINAKRLAGADRTQTQAATKAMNDYLASLKKLFELRTAAAAQPPVVTPADTVTTPVRDLAAEEEAEKKRKAEEEKRKKEAEEREKKHQALLALILKQNQKNRLAEIEDEIERELKTFDTKREEELKKLQEEFGMFAEFETLKTGFAIESAELRTKQEEKLRKDRRDRERKETQDATRDEIEQLRTQQELITGESSKALEERFRLEREARARERTLIDPKDTAAVAVFDAATVRKNAEAENAIELAVRREKIGELKTLAEQELEFKILAIDEALQHELERTDLTELQKTELVRKAEEDRKKIRAEAARAESGIVTLLFNLKEEFEKGFTAVASDEQRKQADDDRAKLDAEAQALKEKLASDQITLKEYNQKIGDIERERSKTTEVEQTKFQLFLLNANKVLSNAFAKSAEDYSQRLATSLANYAATGKGFTQALGDAAGSFVTIVGKAAVEGENIAKASANALVDIAAKFLEAQIPGLIALIFGKSFAEDPLFGGIVAAVATAALFGLVSVARSALAAAKFATGTPWVPGSGTGDTVPAMLTPGERVTPRDTNVRYWNLLNMVHADDPVAQMIERRLREPRGFKYAIDPQGMVVHQQAAQAMQTAQAAMSMVNELKPLVDQLNDHLRFVRRDVARTAEATETTARKPVPRPQKERAL